MTITNTKRTRNSKSVCFKSPTKSKYCSKICRCSATIYTSWSK